MRGEIPLLILLMALSAAADDDLMGQRRVNRASAETEDALTNSLGSWIWLANTQDRQACYFWRSFEIPDSPRVTHAQLRMTVDNEFTLFLDGRELGRGDEWRELFDYNVTPLMSGGRHILAVKAYNSSWYAGMIFGLRIDLADGRKIEIKSDSNWRIVPEDIKGWEKATAARDEWPHASVKALLGSLPWWSKPENVNPMPTLQPITIYFWQTGWFQLSLMSVCAITLLISARLLAQLAVHKKERWLLERERARIARDIHDDLGSRMTQLVLHGEVAQSELPAESGTRMQLDRICEEARGVLSTMDEILWAVNPRHDTSSHFTSYVCGYVQEFLKPTQIQCLFDIAPETSSVVLDLPVRRALLMAIKETLNNAVKHSGATELILQIMWRGPGLVVAVSDNGSGFDRVRTKPGRNGLANMASRMQEVGGSCLVASEAGKGCRVEFDLPLRQARWRPWNWIWDPARFSRQITESKLS